MPLFISAHDVGLAKIDTASLCTMPLPELKIADAKGQVLTQKFLDEIFFLIL